MNYRKYHIALFVFILVVGTLLHFAYDWSGQNTIVSYFSAVNESIWEHLKLLFWPAVIFGVYEYLHYGKNTPCFFSVKMAAILAGLLFTVVFFYTYSGVLGFNLLLLDLADFILADFIICYVSYSLLVSGECPEKFDNIKAILVLLFLILCFVVWTNNPPALGIFMS